jgi:hypothetical protein
MPSKVELFEKGYNCCQIIAVYLAPVCGFDAEEIKESFNIMCDTCGGTCSSLRGGTWCIYNYCEKNGLDREHGKELVDQLYDQFQARHGGILCKDIAKNDIMVCGTYVGSVIELTKALIAQDKAAV